MRTLSTSKLKKISSLMMICALCASFFPISAHAIAGGTFTAAQTQASVAGGLDNTQSISQVTIQTNTTNTAAYLVIDNADLTIRAKTKGTVGNSLSVSVRDPSVPSEVIIGNHAMIMISKGGTTGNAIFIDLNNNFSGITVTNQDIADAINGVSNSMIDVSINQNATDFIEAIGGNMLSAVKFENGQLINGSDGQNQVETFIIGGTIEIGDIFSLGLPQGPISVIATSTDATVVANALNAAVQSSLAYNLQNYTSGVSGNTITVTAKTAGEGFTAGTVTATNAPGVSQIITFTPSNPQVGETFRATINGTDYNHTVTAGQTAADIVNTLAPLMDARADVICSENDAVITCTTTLGALSSYSASVFVPSSDTTAPVITLITPIATGTDTTPDYVFSTTEEGTIMYSGSCASTTTAATVGSNTITLDVLSVGTYTDCSLEVTDSAGNTSNTLAIPSFTISAIVSSGGGGGGGGGGGSRSSSKSSTTTKTTEEEDELICRGPSETGTWYKTCTLDLSSAAFGDFAANAACEGFITRKDNESGYELNKSAPRQEVVAVAVKMLKKDGKPVEMTAQENYKNHFVDIGLTGQTSWIQPVVETALAHGIISDARDTFQPEKSVTRAEAYAMIMASVCMTPVDTETTWQQNVFATAQLEGMTGRTWATFEAESAIMRQDLFVVAARAADWAEKTGGCNPKPAECLAE